MRWDERTRAALAAYGRRMGRRIALVAAAALRRLAATLRRLTVGISRLASRLAPYERVVVVAHTVERAQLAARDLRLAPSATGFVPTTQPLQSLDLPPPTRVVWCAGWAEGRSSLLAMDQYLWRLPDAQHEYWGY